MFCVSLFSVTKFLIYKFELLSLLKRLYSMSSTKNIHDPLPVTPWHRPDLLNPCNIKAWNYKIMLLYEYLTKFISPYLIYLMHFIFKNDFMRAKHWQFLLKRIIKWKHATSWLFLFLLMKKRLIIEIKIVLSPFEVCTVIFCKHQLLLVFVGESFCNLQLNS